MRRISAPIRESVKAGRTAPSRSRGTRGAPGAIALALLAAIGCGPGPSMPGPDGSSARAEPSAARLAPPPAIEPPRGDPGAIRFAEVAAESGIDFVHQSGMTPEFHFPTVFGSGVAILDADGDGRMDLYLLTATRLPVDPREVAPNRLYRNLGGGRFRDVTAASGLGFAGFSLGVAIGDVDNDGDPDVFLTAYRRRMLYENDGHGHFTDITDRSGISSDVWSTCGAFLDYDNDGDLDLYVAGYGDWVWPRDRGPCTHQVGGPQIYCSPRSVRPARHSLLRNNGDRTFSDVTVAAGVARDDGRGLGVVAADVNGDGRPDLYVANDMCPNFLFLNRGDGTFEDLTESAGAALGPGGEVHAGMGVDCEDVDGDGRPELFVTNYIHESNALYRNLGGLGYRDESAALGLAADSLNSVGWGCALADLDNDGWPDGFVTNGRVDAYQGRRGRVTFAEPPLLHRNIEGRRFERATRDAGPYFAGSFTGRGAAFGDLDDDGDLDIVVNHKDAAPALLRNETTAGNRWIRLQLVGTRSNRDAVGARVEVAAGGRTIVRQRKGGTSFASAHDPRLLIGVGKIDVVPRVTVRWPSGSVSRLEDVATNRTHRLVEPGP